MANSDPMKRLARLEKHVETLTEDVADLKKAAWRTTEILTDHSERLGGLETKVASIDDKLGLVVERLDRLISVTIHERTASTERLGDIEKRLTRLEERVGV
jgi:hypothetical protein